MKNFRAFHPFLFAAFPIIAALSPNLQFVSPSEIIRPLIISFLLAGTLLLIFWSIYKDWDRASFMASLILFVVLYYGYPYLFPREINFLGINISRHLIFLAFWVVFINIVGSNWVWKRVRPQVITRFLNILILASFVFPMRLIVPYLLSSGNDPLKNWNRPDYTLEEISPPDIDHLPDIYYIIADGYGRADMLEELYKFDNSEFTVYLEDRGFYVAKNSHSNYIQTYLSFASSLNFEYLDYLGGVNSSNRDPLFILINDSNLRKILENAGYQVMFFTGNVDESENSNTSLNMGTFNRSPLTQFEQMLFSTTMVEALVDTGVVNLTLWEYESHRESVLYNLEQTIESAAQTGPKFVFTHIVSPHPPFIFEANGNPRTPNQAYTAVDGSYFSGSTQDYLQGYINQLRYINTLLEQTIDGILSSYKERGEPAPIIILQGDHGPGAYLDWASAENTCHKERTSILNAYYFPGEKTDLLYESITPVNSFRVFLDTYFGTHLGLLEDKSYYSPWLKPYAFVNVTNESQNPCNGNEK